MMAFVLCSEKYLNEREFFRSYVLHYLMMLLHYLLTPFDVSLEFFRGFF